jgi:hypothetical protein
MEKKIVQHVLKMFENVMLTVETTQLKQQKTVKTVQEMSENVHDHVVTV